MNRRASQTAAEPVSCTRPKYSACLDGGIASHTTYAWSKYLTAVLLWEIGIVEGQIYIPEANWAMMCLTIIVVAGFRDPLAISNAYGACKSLCTHPCSLFQASPLATVEIAYCAI